MKVIEQLNKVKEDMKKQGLKIGRIQMSVETFLKLKKEIQIAEGVNKIYLQPKELPYKFEEIPIEIVNNMPSNYGIVIKGE